MLNADGRYQTTIRVSDSTGVSTFPTTTGTWAWVTIAGSKQFCVTPNVEAQHFPHCYPISVEATRFRWGDVIFERVNPKTIEKVMQGKDTYPDPTSKPGKPTDPDRQES